jgi:hypothetical protein
MTKNLEVLHLETQSSATGCLHVVSSQEMKIRQTPLLLRLKCRLRISELISRFGRWLLLEPDDIETWLRIEFKKGQFQPRSPRQIILQRRF